MRPTFQEGTTIITSLVDKEETRKKKRLRRKKRGEKLFFLRFIPEESELLLIVHAKAPTTLVAFHLLSIPVPIIQERSRYSQHRLCPSPAPKEAEADAFFPRPSLGFHK
jgi:hypothetical protein